MAIREIRVIITTPLVDNADERVVAAYVTQDREGFRHPLFEATIERKQQPFRATYQVPDDHDYLVQVSHSGYTRTIVQVQTDPGRFMEMPLISHDPPMWPLAVDALVESRE